MAMADRLGSRQQLYAHLVHHVIRLRSGPATFDAPPPAEAATAPFAATKLANHWLPLPRLLRARYQLFTTGTAPPGQLARPTRQAHPTPSRAQAGSAAATGDWLSALEHWTQILHGATGALRREAQLARVTALRHLGEHVLADRLLRGMFLYTADATLRQQVFSRLLQTYRQQQDTVALQALLATAVIRHPRPPPMRQLATQLLEDGDDDKALMLGLALPPAEQPTALLLQAALRLGWWQTFDRLVQRLAQPQERHVWLGYRACARGAYETALAHFTQAGPRGRRLAQHFKRGRAIHRDLTSTDRNQRAQTLQAWAAWQAQHPGPHRWQRASHMVRDAAGAALLYNPALDRYIHTFHSTASRPVTLRFVGPAHLRVAARPLHPHGTTAPLDGWI